MTTDAWHTGAAIRMAIAVSLVVVTACVPTPPPKLPDAPQVPFPQKMAWILQLEDQRAHHRLPRSGWCLLDSHQATRIIGGLAAAPMCKNTSPVGR